MRNLSRTASPACHVSKKQFHLNAASNRNAFQARVKKKKEKKRKKDAAPPSLGTPYPMGLLPWLWRSSGHHDALLSWGCTYRVIRPPFEERSNYASHHTLPEQQCAPQFDLPWGERHGGERTSVIRQRRIRVALWVVC
ncbi:hypothetical protein CGRA01v4_08650 [Colletotrichum graminicola]|nr:hypothetical protein CGRA01v4_08650 [Colletotrichum graminicola]